MLLCSCLAAPEDSARAWMMTNYYILAVDSGLLVGKTPGGN